MEFNKESFNIQHKARKNWDSAQILYGRGFYDSAANRLYYSIFQYPYEILIKKGILDPKLSRGVHTEILKFITTYADDNDVIAFQTLLDTRVTADYHEEPVDKPLLDECLKNAKRLRLYITKNFNNLMESDYETKSNTN